MVPFLLALAEALPAAAKFVDAIGKHEDKATTAAKVAADPNAPADVKQAATNVASQAIADKAATEQAALKAVAGKAPAPTGGGISTTTMLLGLGIGLMLMRRRR